MPKKIIIYTTICQGPRQWVVELSVHMNRSMHSKMKWLSNHFKRQGPILYKLLVRLGIHSNFYTLSVTKHAILSHYNDVIMSAMASQITGVPIVYSTVCSGVYKKNSKAPCHWPLCGELTGDRWIPRIKGKWPEIFSIWWRHHGEWLIYLTNQTAAPTTILLHLQLFS